MTLDEIKLLIEFIRAQELTEFELEQDGVKLRVKRGASAAPVHLVQSVPGMAALTATVPASVPGGNSGPGTAPVAPLNPTTDGEPDEGAELAIVKSPIVGTFYRAAEPGAASFVENGDVVKRGQVLCIIEAMKLMNEIESEYDGEIVSIYVENGQAVQYGERLFAIKLKS
jgi:acetyl-CoA carboxylase biotin carboxyl carrier protein